MSARAVQRWSSPHRPVRRVVAIVAAVVAAVAVPLAVVAHWLDATIRDTDRYVATMAPLAHNRTFTDALAVQVTDALYGALPPGVRGSPEAAAAHGTVEQVLADAMASPAFGPVWDAANREAQREAVAVLSGSGTGRVEVALTGLVLLTLHQVGGAPGFVAAVRATASGGQLSVVLLTSRQVAEARRLFADLGAAQWWLTAAAAALLAIALAVAPHRWSLLWWFALAVVVATGLAWAGLDVAGHLVVARGGYSALGPTASGQVFGTLTRGLRRDFLVTMTLAGGLAAVAGLFALHGRHRRGRRRYVLRPA